MPQKMFTENSLVFISFVISHGVFMAHVFGDVCIKV